MRYWLLILVLKIQVLSIEAVKKKKYFLPIKKGEQSRLGINCSEFPEVALIVDSTLQPCYHPSLSFNDAKVFYSGKHRTYGLKKETARLPDGRIAFAFEHLLGSLHDIFFIFSSLVLNLFL